jgi:hypothetical protein
MIQVIKRHKGLGDTVEFLAEKTGIKYAVNKAVELGIIEDCGCDKRKQSLNELVPYGNKREDSEVLRS